MKKERNIETWAEIEKKRQISRETHTMKKKGKEKQRKERKGWRNGESKDLRTGKR